MTRKEFNAMMKEKYGSTPAQWQMYEVGKEFSGDLWKRNELYNEAKPGVKYTICPYFGYTGNSTRVPESIDVIIK